jgi:hypothetical protein
MCLAVFVLFPVGSDYRETFDGLGEEADYWAFGYRT